MNVPASQAAAGLSPPKLHDLLWCRYVRLLNIQWRIHFLRAFSDELTRVTRGKRFRIRNDTTWRAVLDVRDKGVIDLCSWSVEMLHGIRLVDPKNGKPSKPRHKKKGPLYYLRTSHVGDVRRTYTPHPDDDQYEIEMSEKAKEKYFTRLFPGVTTDSPTAGDIDALAERFRARCRPLRDDRNKNRAHVFEGDIGSAKMLSVEEQEAYFAEFIELVEMLSLLSSGSAYAGGGTPAAYEGDVREMVDQILFGSCADAQAFFAGRDRDEAYAELHELHDKRLPRPDDDTEDDELGVPQKVPFFNDMQWQRFIDGT